METLLNIITGLGVFVIAIFIIIAWLIWLFIRSAVASGTKQGIIEAHDILSGNRQERINKDIEEELKGWE